MTARYKLQTDLLYEQILTVKGFCSYDDVDIKFAGGFMIKRTFIHDDKISYLHIETEQKRDYLIKILSTLFVNLK